MDERVGDPLRGKQNQGQDRQRNLQLFRAFLFCGERLLTPSCRLAIAQAPHFPNHIQIQDRTQQSDGHQWDADDVCVKSMRRGVEAGGCGECREADDHSNAAYDHDGGTSALQNGNHKAGPIEPTGIYSWRFRVRRSVQSGLFQRFAQMRTSYASNCHCRLEEKFGGISAQIQVGTERRAVHCGLDDRKTEK